MSFDQESIEMKCGWYFADYEFIGISYSASVFLNEPGPIFFFFFQTFLILVSQESSHFSHTPYKILLLKYVSWRNY